MAYVGCVVSYTMTDADGEKRALTLQGSVPDTSTVLQLETELLNIAELLDTVTDGQVYKASVTLQLGLPTETIKQTPVAGSEVERGADFPWTYQAGSGYRQYSMFVPAFKYSKFVSGTNLVNMDDADVTGFLDALYNAVHVVFTEPSGIPFYAYLPGAKVFRKQRRSTSRT